MKKYEKLKLNGVIARLKDCIAECLEYIQQTEEMSEDEVAILGHRLSTALRTVIELHRKYD